jgi:hypothetical protein
MTQPGIIPVPMFCCALCNRQTPAGQPHVCEGLSDRQKRKIHAWKHLQAIHARRRVEPTPCPDCQTPMVPGQAHACLWRTDKASSAAAEWQMGGFKSALARLGFEVTKKTS